MASPASPVRFLDLSGFGFSGKTALIELIREFRGYAVPHHTFEFLLLRIQGGILDLENALVNDWSPIRSDAAIRRFKRLIRRLGTKNSLSRPTSLFEAVGWNYDEIYAGRFTKLSEEYVERLVLTSWTTDWPYPAAEQDGVELFTRKVLSRAGVRSALDVRVYLSLPDDFVGVTREYLAAVLTSNVPAGTKTVVMHNAFEPFQPQRCLKFFDDAKCIVVDRDPRDTYVQQLGYRPMAVSAADFVARFRIYRDAVRRFAQPHSSILRIQFEDLVRRYDETLQRILGYLGESADVHERPRTSFNPDVSRGNIGLWKTYPHQNEIELICRELGDYCVD